MSYDPKRLRRSSSSPLAREILSAARHEEPSQAALTRTLVAVGAGASVAAAAGSAAASTAVTSTVATSTVATSTAAAGGTATSGAAAATAGAGLTQAGAAGVSGALAGSGGASVGAATATGAAAKLGSLMSGAVMKWIAVGVVSTGAVVGTYEWSKPSSADRPSAALSTPADTPAAPSPPTVARSKNTSDRDPSSSSPSTIDDATIDDADSAVPRLAPQPRAAGDTGASAKSQLTSPKRSPIDVSKTSSADRERSDASADLPLAAEVQAVDQARQALKGGNPSRALSELSGYERTFPERRLYAEVLFIRMEAYSASGDPGRAAHIAQSILRYYPSSPLAARARRVLESSSATVSSGEDQR